MQQLENEWRGQAENMPLQRYITLFPKVRRALGSITNGIDFPNHRQWTEWWTEHREDFIENQP